MFYTDCFVKLKGESFFSFAEEARRVMDMAQTKKAIKNNRSKKKIASLDKEKATSLVKARIAILAGAEIIIGAALTALKKTDLLVLNSFHNKALPVLRYVLAALALAAAAYLIVSIVKDLDTSADVMTPSMVFAIVMSLAVTVAFFDRLIISTYLFWIAAAVLCILFTVYYVYTVLMYKK